VPTVAADSENGAFLTIAEGLSSGPQDRGIQAGHRMFSRPNLLKICAKAATPAKLENNGPAVGMLVGKWFSLGDLRVIAKDVNGNRLPPVPLMLEVDKGAGSLFNFEPEMLQSDRVLPTRPGTFRFRIRTACPGTSVETFIEATVGNP
jgi:hypothetical protein